MKAVVKLRAGAGNVVYKEVEEPIIDEKDVLLEVKAAGICGSDIRLMNFGNSDMLKAPVIMGHEFAGIIKKTGVKVKNFKAGERVVSDNEGYICGKCCQCSVGNYMLCENLAILGFGLNGGFTKYVKISGNLLEKNPNALYRIPDNVSYEEAAMLDPSANAYKAVIEEGKLMPGDDVVIFGCGTIGLLAVQIAKIAGAANIIVINRSENKYKFGLAKKFGADIVITSEKEDVEKCVYEVTAGNGVPLVIDCAGKNSILKQSVAILGKNGKYVKIGYDREPLDISLDAVLRRGIQIIGHFAYDYISCKNVLKLMEKRMLDLESIITCRLPLDSWREGFDIAQSRNGLKVILKP